METAWRVRVKPRCRDVALGDIKPTVVGAWLAEMGQGTEDTKALGAAAVKRAHHVLSRVLADAVVDNLIPKNPAAGLTLPKTSRKAHIYPTHQQVDAWFGGQVIDGLCEVLDEHQAARRGREMRPAAIGCVPWLTSEGVVDRLVKLNSCCVVIDKGHRATHSEK